MLNYVVTGTGRCGTRYLARVLHRVGVCCDHEQVFSAGGIREDRHYLGGATSSWLAVPFLESSPGLIGPETTLIHLIRHPKDFIESVLRLRIFSPDCPPNYMPYRDFILRNMPSIQMGRDIDAAAHFWVGWNNRIEDQYSRFATVIPWRIEYPPEALLDALGLGGDIGDIDRTTNTREWWAEGSIPRQVTLDDIENDTIRAKVIEKAKGYGYNTDRGKTPNVHWAVLLERNVSHQAVNSLLHLAEESGRRGFRRLSVPYGRTDYVRNEIVRSFIRASTCKDDVLIMLDNDHRFPTGMLSRLAAHDKPIVAALAFRRGRPFDPLFYRDVGGRLVNPAEWEEGALYEADAVGTGAIAIKRWVFTELERQGQHFPFFRYQYAGAASWKATEDVYFSYICGKAGVQMYCDTGVEIPHQTATFIDHTTWDKFKKDHPDVVGEVE